jgi:hypothetical protein
VLTSSPLVPAAGRAPAIATPKPKAMSVPKAHSQEVRKPSGEGKKKKKRVVQCNTLPPIALSMSFLDMPRRHHRCHQRVRKYAWVVRNIKFCIGNNDID